MNLLRRFFPMAVVPALLFLGAVKTNIEYVRPADGPVFLDASSPPVAEGMGGVGGGGPFPMVILVHGGGWSSGDKAKDFTTLFQPLTDHHFVWFSINYRLAPAHRWPACFEDVKSAIRWVKAHGAEYHGDTQRIALIGYSAGGQLACLAAVTADESTRVQAVVGMAPPTDLELDLPTRGGLSPSLQGLLDRPHLLTAAARGQLREMSAVDHLHAGLPPFLLVHGTADKSVPYQGSLNFQAKLKALGVPCELITLPGAPHNSAKWDAARPGYEMEIIHWLEKILAAAPARGTGGSGGGAIGGG